MNEHQRPDCPCGLCRRIRELEAALRAAGTDLVFMRAYFEAKRETVKVNTIKCTLDKVHAALSPEPAAEGGE